MVSRNEGEKIKGITVIALVLLVRRVTRIVVVVGAMRN